MSEKAKLYLGYCPAGEDGKQDLPTLKRYLSLCQATLLDLPAACHLVIDDNAFEVCITYDENETEQVEAAQFCEACAPINWEDNTPVRFTPNSIILSEDGTPELRTGEAGGEESV